MYKYDIYEKRIRKKGVTISRTVVQALPDVALCFGSAVEALVPVPVPIGRDLSLPLHLIH